MAFKDFTDFLDGEYIDLPVKGTKYRIHSPGAKTGLQVQRIMALAGKANTGADLTDDEQDSVFDGSDEEAATFTTRLMGDAYQQMINDDVPIAALNHAIATVMQWAAGADRDALERFWNARGRTEGKAPADRKAKATGPAAAPTTQSRASTSGTTKPRPRKAAARTAHGRTS